jgi:4-aminobutyrate aminotransferase/(S)-3-amino-2-methylpropionate transaminase
VLVMDEIQTGMGRAGRLFASEFEGVAGDLTLTVKALAGGLPLSAVTGRAELMNAPHTGGLGGTYAGNPVACAAALGVFDAFEDGTLLANALAIEAMARAQTKSTPWSSGTTSQVSRPSARPLSLKACKKPSEKEQQ